MITDKEYKNVMYLFDFMKNNDYDVMRLQQDTLILNHYASAAIVPLIQSALKTKRNVNLMKVMGIKIEEAVTDTYLVFMRRLDTVLMKQEVTIQYLQLMINNIVLDMYKSYLSKKKEFVVTETFWNLITDGNYCMEDMVGMDMENAEKLQVVYKKAACFKKINAIAFFGVTVLNIPATLLSEAVNKKGVDFVYKYVISAAAKEYKHFPLSLFTEKAKMKTPMDRTFTAKDLRNYNSYCLKLLKKELQEACK